MPPCGEKNQRTLTCYLESKSLNIIKSFGISLRNKKPKRKMGTDYDDQLNFVFEKFH